MARNREKLQAAGCSRDGARIPMHDHLRRWRCKTTPRTRCESTGHIGFFLQWCKERGLTEPVESDAARAGAVSAASVPLPQEEWRAVELPFAALVSGPVARVVPVDDAAESHPA